jgi:hypothetical protein
VPSAKYFKKSKMPRKISQQTFFVFEVSSKNVIFDVIFKV